MWGFVDKETGEFMRYYDEFCVDAEGDEWESGFRLYIFETELEAIKEFEFWSEVSLYPDQFLHYEVAEIPADEPVWKSYDY